ncbi:hypothetical protein MmiEs2_01260 [Methanimicrococcus stummii]|uniref:Exosome complex component Csl4 n=1 Tax=Methanimicrococcus stummii TaxID=3028294 RepID=A0AA96VKC2_9EURY|nr:exosome complex RNA-binding protein Csl4 [Methanimicrococcus sp. Es2]WNY27947.1 hypothetical protein MmiEs2_01260 [Methanimicrococcus sp. Es2]
MSRVQKKPIRRRLKDTAGKPDEPRATEPVAAAPAEDSQKPRIPRKPRPEIAKQEAEAPVRRASRPRATEAESSEAEDKPRRAPAERAERPERRSDSGSERSSDRRGGDRNGGRDGNRSRDRDGGRDGGRGRDRNGGRGDRNGKGGFGGRKPAEKKKRPEKIVYEKTKEFVFPGDIVGAIEEYKPGFGTVNDDGTIRATVSGVIGINKEHRMVSVIPKTKTLNTITEGDIVIASISDVRESNARVNIVAAEKSLDEEIVNNGNAEIYVSNIKDGFAKSVSDEFSVGDIVRAKVIDSSKIGLSTVDSDLGVLKAYCSRCKTSLTRSDDGLVCSNCGNRERRKLADGYGKGIPSV